MGEILRIENLHTHFMSPEGIVKAVNGVNLSLSEDQVLALVGESGSGKSVTALSIMRLIPHPGRIVEGRIRLNGEDLLQASPERLREIRGRDIAIVFQDPRTALNPVLPIGKQLEELLFAHLDIDKEAATDRAIDLLQEMGLADPRKVLDRYPFHLSGGMCQRVMLAMALALSPKVLIADEPTSNLDTPLQAEMLARLKRLQRETHAAILLITHDMGVVANMAHDVAVMYAGSIVEYAGSAALFRHPSHPYTWGLFQALPRVDRSHALRVMRGGPPDLTRLPAQCPFLPRCPKALNVCRLTLKPPLEPVQNDHRVACYNPVVVGEP